MASSYSAGFQDGFPEVLKRSAFEEIIGNYYAFDPFLQPGRRGRELNKRPGTQNSAVPVLQSSSSDESFNDDPTLYSIPPAITPSESRDQIELDSDLPIVLTSAPVNSGMARLNDLNEDKQKPNTQQQKFDSFNKEDYPLYPPFLTEQSVRQQQQLLPAKTSEKNFPRYVIGVAQEQRHDDDKFFDSNSRSGKSAFRQTIYRGQLAKGFRTPAVELDDSPFAQRSLEFVNYDKKLNRNGRGLFQSFDNDRIYRHDVTGYVPYRHEEYYGSK